MSKTSTTKNDLTTLQREVKELQESRSKNGSAETEVSEAINDCDPVTKNAEGTVFIDEGGNNENSVHDITGQIENYLKDLELTALERPTLALLTTFAVGVVVGHYISRR